MTDPEAAGGCGRRGLPGRHVRSRTVRGRQSGAACTLLNEPGTVHSRAERDLATRSAWGSAGVRKVFDKMTMAY